MGKRKTIISAALLLLVSGQSGIANEPAAHKANHAPSNDHGGARHWTYEGPDGPLHWGEIDHNFEACELGKQQSPIDIKATISADLPSIYFNYTATPTSITNNGHTIQVNVFDNNGISVDGQEFALAQFHFHTPSEYHIEGKAYPLEVHFVHKNEQGALAVIGVMIKEGAANEDLEGIFAGAPTEAGRTLQLPDAKTEIRHLIPNSPTYYRFMGSLTTPPCSEGVNWHMMTTPIEASKAQIDKFRSLFTLNARPLQPVNNRLVVKDTR